MVFRKLQDKHTHVPMNKLSIWLPSKLVHDAIDKEFLNTLAYFCILKKVYIKGRFYNYNKSKVAKQIGVSYNTLDFHVNKMIELNLAYFRDGNLCLYGFRKLKAKFGQYVTRINFSNKKSELILNIRSNVVLREINRQESKVSKNLADVKNAKRLYHEDSKQPIRKSLVKKVNKAGGIAKFVKDVDEAITLSNNGFGRYINRSPYTGARLQKRMNELKYIKSHKNYKRVESKMTLEEFNFFKEARLGTNQSHYFFDVKNNCVMKRSANKIEVMKAPQSYSLVIDDNGCLIKHYIMGWVA